MTNTIIKGHKIIQLGKNVNNIIGRMIIAAFGNSLVIYKKNEQ